MGTLLIYVMWIKIEEKGQNILFVNFIGLILRKMLRNNKLKLAVTMSTQTFHKCHKIVLNFDLFGISTDQKL